MTTATLRSPVESHLEREPSQFQPTIPGLIAMPPAMMARAEQENWPYYRLMIGGHEEKILPPERDEDGSLRSLRVKRGDVFRSPLNLLAHNRGSEKFQLLYGGGQFQSGNNPNQDVWDRTRESLEQFVERVKNRPQQLPVGVSQVLPGMVPNMPEAIQPPGFVPTPNAAQVANVGALPPSAQTDLAEHDEKKLRAIAAEEEVDVSRCRTKAELVTALRKALGNKSR